MNTPSPSPPTSALDILRDRTKYDLDAKPERWQAGPPFETLDVRPGRVLILGAPPGAGKTTLALQLVCQLLDQQPDLRCVIGNVETAPAVLIDKILARLAGVTLDAIMNRQFLADERQLVENAIEANAEMLSRIAFHDGVFSIPSVYETMRSFNARLVVLDYIQRFTAGDKEDRARLDAVMDQVRVLAHQGAAVIVISSVSRQKNARGGSTYAGLSMAAFRGSAELEFGADSAYLLDCDPRTGVAKLECVKTRFGLPQDVPLRFIGPYQRFDAGDPLDGFDAATGGTPS